MLFVFMSQPDFACNPYALYEYIKNNTEHETAWLVKKDERYYELVKRGVRCAVYDTLAGCKLVEEADYVITNSYTFQRLAKKDNQIFVNVWHGSGIKAHDYYNHNMNPEHAKQLQFFFEKIDLMCVHSLDDRFKLAAQLHYDLRKCYVTGQARLDCVTTSDGLQKLKKIYGAQIEKYDKYIFFAPSFRANSSSHSGTIFSDNIFRLDDYNDAEFNSFLEKNNAVLIYKLHPIEQTAFSGRKFELSSHCFELTDAMLFENDIRYDELLNAFDVMMSDYSSIAYDFLALNRPIVYLIPDYEEYTSARGFVFNNVNVFMPGEKAFNFGDMLSALVNSFENPDMYQNERENVIAQRFDFNDNMAAKRTYETIINYRPVSNTADEKKEKNGIKMPSSAELMKEFIPKEFEIIDSTKDIAEEQQIESVKNNLQNSYLYITEEIPGELRKLTGRSSTEICDIAYYYDMCKFSNVKICQIEGGVDYGKFSKIMDESKMINSGRRSIGFAGTVDNRIYFAMVQCICEVFSDFDIIFAGEIFGNYPVWLSGFDNLHYIPATYDELPGIIGSFDVAILPFFGRHAETVPKELYQFLASGKQVVASNMERLPKCKAIYISKSVEDAIANIKKALQHIDDKEIILAAKELAEEHDWKILAEKCLC